METTQIKQVGDALLNFSAFMLLGEANPQNLNNTLVVNYALSYILRLIKDNPNDKEIYNHYKEVFWYIANNYKTN